MGDLPLTYSPLESKTVGSSSLVSSVAKTYFGEIAPLLPAQSGRGKVTIYPQSDIFIGGSGLSKTNAIKILGGQKFEISTQGEVNAEIDTKSDEQHREGHRQQVKMPDRNSRETRGPNQSAHQGHDRRPDQNDGAQAEEQTQRYHSEG